MKTTIILAIAFVAGPALAGPLSKFDRRPPVADYVSALRLEDIERCLSDMDNQPVPIAFRQPDRPDEVKLLWAAGSGVDSRIDLRRDGAGTHVRSWMGAKQALNCAPK